MEVEEAAYYPIDYGRVDKNNELNISKSLVIYTSQRSEELRLYNLV
jgi:hypothetical protein